MKRQRFLDKYIGRLEGDSEIADVLGRVETEEGKAILKQGLENAVASAYDSHANDYFGKRGILGRVADGLRYMGLAANSVGAASFWLNPGTGFGLKWLGLGLSSVADLIYNRHYRKHSQKKWLRRQVDNASTLSESLVERAAAYVDPFAVGSGVDFLRMKDKYDYKIIKAAVRQAKKNFMDSYGSLQLPEQQPDNIVAPVRPAA
jgi:hypothetical protein